MESCRIPQFIFLNSVGAIYTKLSHGIAENLQISGSQKVLCIPDYLLKDQALSSHTQLQKVSSHVENGLDLSKIINRLLFA